MTTTPRCTPVREALAVQSTLAVHVHNGLGAVKDKDKKFINALIRTQFADSLDTDESFRIGRDQEPRWDYLLGHESDNLIAVEPHSAKTDEIQAVIKKRSRWSSSSLATSSVEGVFPNGSGWLLEQFASHPARNMSSG